MIPPLGNIALSVLTSVMVGSAAFAGAAALAALTPCDGDEVYPADYRHEICGVLVRRALVIAAERAGGLAHV